MTTDDAASFVNDAEARLAAVNVEQQRAAWVAENFITEDTQAIAAQASEKQINLGVDLAKQAARFDGGSRFSFDVRRKLELIESMGEMAGRLKPVPGPDPKRRRS